MDEYYVHNKPNYRVYLALVIIPVHVGMGLGRLYGVNLGAENLTVRILRALIIPFPIRITPLTGPLLAASLLIYAMMCLYHISTVHNYMPGKE